MDAFEPARGFPEYLRFGTFDVDLQVVNAIKPLLGDERIHSDGPDRPALSRAGVKIHLGKGSLSKETGRALNEYNALFAVTPPVSALMTNRMLRQRVAAFKEEGMEALYEVEVENLPAIIAIAKGQTIFSDDG